MILKITEELCVMTMKVCYDLRFKIWREEFDEFLPKHSKVSKKLSFKGLFLTKVYDAWAKKVERTYIW